VEAKKNLQFTGHSSFTGISRREFPLFHPSLEPPYKVIRGKSSICNRWASERVDFERRHNIERWREWRLAKIHGTCIHNHGLSAGVGI